MKTGGKEGRFGLIQIGTVGLSAAMIGFSTGNVSIASVGAAVAIASFGIILGLSAR